MDSERRKDFETLEQAAQRLLAKLNEQPIGTLEKRALRKIHESPPASGEGQREKGGTDVGVKGFVRPASCCVPAHFSGNHEKQSQAKVRQPEFDFEDFGTLRNRTDATGCLPEKPRRKQIALGNRPHALGDK